MKDFKTPKDLLDFVLEICGGVKFDVIFKSNVDSKNIGQIVCSLTINKNFDLKRIYFAQELLLEKFDTIIQELYIQCQLEDEDLEGDYLSMIPLRKLVIVDNKINITKLPELPDTIKFIYTNYSNCPDINVRLSVLFKIGHSNSDWKVKFDSYNKHVSYIKQN